MAKTKKQQEKEEFEELKRRALEPFKPHRSMEEVLKYEEEVREKSIKTIHEMKEKISDSELATIKSRADFTHTWNE